MLLQNRHRPLPVRYRTFLDISVDRLFAAPGFVLALSDPKDPKKVKGLSFLRGAQPFASFKTQIDNALNTVK